MLDRALQYKNAEECHAEQIAALVQDTVRVIYPNYYLPEVVSAFVLLHSAEAIEKDIRQGSVYGLWLDGLLIGTGTRQSCHISRVYVAPSFQGRGYGSFIMDRLEQEISQTYPVAQLDASLPACQMYERRGYRTVRHGRWPLENGVILVYEIMEKSLGHGDKGACYGP